MTTFETTQQTRTAHSDGILREQQERVLDGIYGAPGVHWVGDGFRVRSYFTPSGQLARKLSPFLLLDYNAPYDFAPSPDRRRGVGTHPHRGFETVTLAFQGSVAHHDSSGGGGVIHPGDVQWMTAGGGILHREYHEEAFSRRGGTFHMVQLWVNLPRAHKMTPARYQALPAEGMGQVTLDDGAGTVRVIAGEYLGTRGPAKTFSPVTLLDAHVKAGKQARFTVPAHENAAILVMSGSVVVQGKQAQASELALFANSGERITVEASTDAQFLLMSGEPIDEPIVAYGPFVMNSEREIVQAFEDFNAGKFGHLDD